MALVIDVNVGESVELNGNIKITLREKTGQRAKLIIEGDPPPKVVVSRDLGAKIKPNERR